MPGFAGRARQFLIFYSTSCFTLHPAATGLIEWKIFGLRFIPVTIRVDIGHVNTPRRLSENRNRNEGKPFWPEIKPM